MKILLLCKKYPFPLKDGESVAIYNLGRSLVEVGADVHLLCMNTSKHYYEGETPDKFSYLSSFSSVDVQNNITFSGALKNLFGDTSYHLERFISKEFDKKLQFLISSIDFDIVQLETFYLSPYIDTIRKHSSAKVVLRSHNLEHEVWERIGMNTKNLAVRLYLNTQIPRLKKEELEAIEKVDLLMPISRKDEEKFAKIGLKKPVHTIPIGIDLEEYITKTIAITPNTISFIGSMDWMPNIEGINWFLKDIWETIHAKYPDMELHIAGRNSPNWLKSKKSKNVFCHGEVESAKEFVEQHQMMVVPLKSGSGIRAKIIEAMALGRIVISTEIGLEGIGATHLDNILIANDLNGFVKCITLIKNNPILAQNIQKNAKIFIGEYFDRKTLAKNLIVTYKKLTGIKQMQSKPKLVTRFV